MNVGRETLDIITHAGLVRIIELDDIVSARCWQRATAASSAENGGSIFLIELRLRGRRAVELLRADRASVQRLVDRALLTPAR